ncbi:TetR/AcrR family transcriptional regulator [Phycicoccus sp. MAQZ13P-2]|nr:TetR/AcrR family transcriptional regulator [Phycicoccus mangrovi]MBT9256023.1 TetR/AcrR family transcriptional regulator [Phycicoccus mangrovi]MBT9273964.1 TetR/AcrR family transcriptional regulator [Phycicoccus mangrovi]
MGGFTIERVAAESGASKVTIYKLWPSKGALALEGYFTTVEPVLAFPDTGDLVADLRAQLHAFVDLLTTTPAGDVLRGLIAEGQRDPVLQEAYLSTYAGPRRALAVDRMEAARRQGGLREGVDPETVVDQLWGACYHRLLIPDRPLDHAFADRLLDHLAPGLVAAPTSRRAGGRRSTSG